MPLADALRELCAELESGEPYQTSLAQIAEEEDLRAELLDRKFRESYGSPERYVQRKTYERAKLSAINYKHPYAQPCMELVFCRGEIICLSGRTCFLAAVTNSEPSMIIGIECRSGEPIVEEFERKRASDLVATWELKALGLA